MERYELVEIRLRARTKIEYTATNRELYPRILQLIEQHFGFIPGHGGDDLINKYNWMYLDKCKDQDREMYIHILDYILNSGYEPIVADGLDINDKHHVFRKKIIV